MSRSRLPSMLRSSRTRLFGLLGLVGLVASACASNAQQTTLEPQGPAADKINDLSNITFAIAGVVFVIVEVGVLFVVWKFRKRKDDTDDDIDSDEEAIAKTGDLTFEGFVASRSLKLAREEEKAKKKRAARMEKRKPRDRGRGEAR